MSKFNLSKIESLMKSKSMSLSPPPEIDTLSIKQIGDYTIGEEIGSGAFGKVVLGKHILTGEKVAIKILDKMILNQTPEDYELVRQEISILKLVKHKYIVQLYEIMQTAQHIFIIMEYCEGKEIMDYILTKTRLNELESLKYFRQLINTLFYLHSQNIAHRDIKIDNMLLDKDKDLKLIDFGLSTKYTDDSLLDQPCGTVVYAAPEVLEGKEYHGMLADVWSSGIVLYGMLAGFLPFSDKNDEVNKKQVIKGEINIPDFFPDLVKDLLKHMLDVDPMTRYTLQEIKEHPWFNINECVLIPGIIIDYNIVPVDEKILNLCVTYNKDKNEVFNSVRNNKYDSNSALYYLLVKQLRKKGFKSVSDLCSDEFIDYILDENNLVEPNKENPNNEENNDYKIDIEDEKEEEIIIDKNNIDNNMAKILDNKIEEMIDNNIDNNEDYKLNNNIDNNLDNNIDINLEKNDDFIIDNILNDNKDNNEDYYLDNNTDNNINLDNHLGNNQDHIKDNKENIEETKEDENRQNNKEENKNIEQNNGRIKITKEPSKKEILEEELKEEEILKEKKEYINDEIVEKPNKLIDLINESYSQNSINSKEKEINKDIINNNPNASNKENNNSNEIILENQENNRIEKIVDKKYPKNTSENFVLNENNIAIIPEKIQKEDENEKENIQEKIEKEENENKNNEEKKIIVEEGKKELEETKINEQELEKNHLKNENDIIKRNLFEEKIKEEDINIMIANNKEEDELGLRNLDKKDDNKEDADLGLRKLDKKDDNNKNGQINERKEEIITKIEVVDINISKPIKQNKKNNKNNENQKNIRKLTEERVFNQNINGKNIQKRGESLESIKRGNSQQIILSSEIILNLNDDIKKRESINTDHNISNNKQLRKSNNEIINDIEVIGIKINKNEKHINFKNENKRYKKENEKSIKSKIFGSKKSNNNINKTKNIYKNNNQILFSMEKSNNISNNLKINQTKFRFSCNPKIVFGTEIKYNKNRSVFKITNIKNNYKKDNFVEKNLRKDPSHNTNYSTRNTKKKLIFTKSKPELDKKFMNKKNNLNLKKKSSNQIFSIINNKNKNNFLSTTTNFKLKNLALNSTINYQSTKNVKKVNLQSKFEEIGNNKIEDIKEHKMRLSLNIKISNSKKNKSPINKNNINKKYNNKKNLINYNYSSLLPPNKNGFNNINTINSNILKSIIGSEKEVKKNASSLKNKLIAQEIQKKYNKSITNNTLDRKMENKNKEEVINIKIKNKPNKKKSKHLESSVNVNRYKSPITIKELSESPKQKYLNIKTRYTRMPWKVKKKGIDEKIDPNVVYHKYINRLINPLNQNNNKVVNIKKFKKSKSIRNSKNKAKLNKTLWPTNIKQIKIEKNNFCCNLYNKKYRKNKDNSTRNKKAVSKEQLSPNMIKYKFEIEAKNKLLKKKNSNNIMPYTPNKSIRKNINLFGNSNIKISSINSLSSMNFYTNYTNKKDNSFKNKYLFSNIKYTSENQKIKDKEYFTLKKPHHKHSNSVSSSLLVNLKNRFCFNNNINYSYTPIDLSCLFLKYKTISEFCDFIKNKLKKRSISFIQNKSNSFFCNKNENKCKFEIIRIDNNNTNFRMKSICGEVPKFNDTNILYLKVSSQKEGYRINEVFKKFVLSLH